MSTLLFTKFKKKGRNDFDQELNEIEIEIKNRVVKWVKKQSKGSENLDEVEGMVTPLLNKVRKGATESLFENQDVSERVCNCGNKMSIKEKLPRKITGLVKYEIKRRSFYCNQCNIYEQPLDHYIECVGGYTLEIKKAITLLGQRLPFSEASDYLGKLLKVQISHGTFQIFVEAIGKKIAKDEKKSVSAAIDENGYIKNWDAASSLKKGAAYLEMDGTMACTREEGWKEVRNGVLFAQKDIVRPDKNHREIMKKKYFSVSNTSENALAEFKDRTSFEAYELGFHRYETPVILGDGAKWIWDYANVYHPDAIQILDYYHAADYLGSAFKSLKFEDEKLEKQEKDTLFDWLWDGKINVILDYLAKQTQTDNVANCLRYYKNNRHRMKYKYYRDKGLEIGSGAIESAHKIIVHSRLKQAGMRWNKHNVQSMVSLRSKYLSGEWDQIVCHYLLAA